MSKGIWLFVVLSGFADHAVAATQDKAGNRIEPLPRHATSDNTTRTWSCTDDGHWCARVDTDGHLDAKFIGNPEASTNHVATWSDADDEETFRLWPMTVRLADGGVVFGVLRDVSTTYSGGDASATELQLFEVHDAREPEAIVRIPISGHAMIRACFSEKDLAQRAGACHDVYTFTGDLDLDGTTREGRPAFRFATLATSYPGHVSRSEDSLAAPSLRENDLGTVTDKHCSYRRTFRVDPATGHYRPDAPLPPCSDYTEP